MGKMTTRRKLAIATWSAPQEGNIYGKLTVDVTNALRYIDDRREASGEKVTITHLVGKAVANALAEAPDLNGRIVFGSFVPHETVDVTFLVVLDGGSDLAKVKVERADEKSPRSDSSASRLDPVLSRAWACLVWTRAMCHPRPSLGYLSTFCSAPFETTLS